jgi:hypothetical protein
LEAAKSAVLLCYIEEGTADFSRLAGLPARPAQRGRVAQLAEHSTLNRQVEGSIPSASTNMQIRMGHVGCPTKIVCVKKLLVKFSSASGPINRIFTVRLMTGNRDLFLARHLSVSGILTGDSIP